MTILLDRDMETGLGTEGDILRIAISQLKGVEGVTYGEPIDFPVIANRDAALSEFRTLLYQFLGLFTWSSDADKLRRVREILEYNTVKRG